MKRLLVSVLCLLTCSCAGIAQADNNASSTVTQIAPSTQVTPFGFSFICGNSQQSSDGLSITVLPTSVFSAGLNDGFAEVSDLITIHKDASRINLSLIEFSNNGPSSPLGIPMAFTLVDQDGPIVNGTLSADGSIVSIAGFHPASSQFRLFLSGQIIQTQNPCAQFCGWQVNMQLVPVQIP